jgi:hypothetical protein
VHDRAAERLRGLAPLRARVDAAAALEPELVRDWFPAISALVLASMDVRMEIERQLDAQAPQALRTLFEVNIVMERNAQGGLRWSAGNGPPFTIEGKQSDGVVVLDVDNRLVL